MIVAFTLGFVALVFVRSVDCFEDGVDVVERFFHAVLFVFDDLHVLLDGFHQLLQISNDVFTDVGTVRPAYKLL
mgnify:CR=1 FL=1